MNKREFLALVTTTACTLSVPKTAWSQPKFRENPFTLGVASGAPTSDSVVLWTRLCLDGLFGSAIGNAPITVQWELALDEQFKNILQTGQQQAIFALAHSVHVEVPNLVANSRYFYRFMVGDAISATGRTRTLPLPEGQVDSLRIAYASCQRYDHGYFCAYKHMIKDNIDFVLFLGDYIYEYPGSTNAVRLPDKGWVLTLDDYRARYALHKREPELQAMHAACPWLMTWDDHEVQNDYAGMNIGENGPAVLDFSARRASAYQAFYEHMPIRAATLTKALGGLASGAELRIYQQLQFGKLATMQLLDNRQYRSIQACTRNGAAGSSQVDPTKCTVWNDPSRTMLGPEQEAWFKSHASSSTAPWNLIAQSTLFGQRNNKIGEVQTFWNDGWDGYAPARARVVEALTSNKIAMPVMIGGDIHANWVGHVKADYQNPESKAVGVEFCGAGITARGGGNEGLLARLARNPHFVFADQERNGYGVLEVTPKQINATLRVVDTVTRSESSIQTLASFTVLAGRPEVLRT